ncbi:MAG: chromosomal replication initiator protein DnaA [Clostridia bacterium]|nr:chromosomal replication initiator protein DnaA [Clostridia bacterium]
MKLAEEIWAKVLDLMSVEVSKIAFTTWIKPISPVMIDDKKIVLKVPHDVNREMLQSKYISLLSNCIKEVADKKLDIEIILESEDTGRVNNNTKKKDEGIPLDPNLSFETFIVGKNSNVAYAAALAVAEAPGGKYNPLYLFGGSGLGKTHILQAIGNYFKENYPEKKVLYTTSERFTYELVTAIHEKTNQAFRDKYRNVDLLLIDDVQYLSKTELALEEFFHTFNALHDAGKQIILTCDRMPSEIPQLPERLVSRFNSGLTVDIQPPDYETRMAILQSKFERESLTLGSDAIEFIASNIRSNVRDLEGAVSRIELYAGIKRVAEVDLDLVMEAINDIVASQGVKVADIPLIIKEVERYFSLSDGALISKKRSQDIALPRQIAMYLCREILDSSFPKIGDEFGGRDHTTVMHSVKKIQSELKEDKNMKTCVDEITVNIKSN